MFALLVQNKSENFKFYEIQYYKAQAYKEQFQFDRALEEIEHSLKSKVRSS